MTDFVLSLLALTGAYISLLAAYKSKKYSHHKNKIIAALFIATLAYSFVGIKNFSVERSGNPRAGMEKFVDLGTKQLLTKTTELQSRLFPSPPIVTDDVPPHLQTSKGSFSTKIYYVDHPIDFEPFSKEIFAGNFDKFQSLHKDKFFTITTIILLLSLIAIAASWYFKSDRLVITSLVLISALSICFSLRLAECWDEFFINLRHAYMLVNHGVYSVNANNMIEGTVDFIPIFGTAIFGFLGANLISAFISFSLLGNVAVIVSSFLIINKLTKNQTWALICALIIGSYPNVISIGGTGFSASLFSGWMLAASYFILFTNRRLLGLIILSLLTLVRTEGILFAALLMAYVYIIKPLPETISSKKWLNFIKPALIDGVIVLIPFVISLIVRYYFFGQAVPNPALFKNTNFNNAYFEFGVSHHLFDIISNHDLHLMALLILLLLAANSFACKNNEKLKEWSGNIKKLLALDVIFLIFIMPYFANGGDWFPAEWNRYGLPLNLAISITILTLVYGAFIFSGLSKKISYIALVVFCLSIAGTYIKSAQTRSDNYLFKPSFSKNRWGARSRSLSELGKFLKATTPENAVISSPEEATIMYFAERDMLGLLGVTNPEMTKMPLQPIIHHHILMHRKRGQESIYKNQPDIIALYEPVFYEDFKDIANLRNTLSTTFDDRIFGIRSNISYYRVGSYESLRKMGYQHFTILHQNMLFSIFVGPKIRDQFVQNILAQNFKYFGTMNIKYSIDPDLTKAYAPAAKELMKDLKGK